MHKLPMHMPPQQANAMLRRQLEEDLAPLDFRKLAHFSDEGLGRYDILETHLACTAGLPGAEKIDRARCIAEVNRLTDWVRRYTEYCLAHPDPANSGDSPGVYRMRAMFTCLWKGAKIRYNPAKIPDDSVWTWEDSFVHTALFGDGGTCGSLPVLYTAIGRRLGYPLKLVSSWGPKWSHLFLPLGRPGRRALQRGSKLHRGRFSAGRALPAARPGSGKGEAGQVHDFKVPARRTGRVFGGTRSWMPRGGTASTSRRFSRLGRRRMPGEWLPYGHTGDGIQQLVG